MSRGSDPGLQIDANPRLEDPVAGLERDLRARQGRDGGWAAWPDGPSDTESTAWSVLALRSAGGGSAEIGPGRRSGPPMEAIASGRAWLRRMQAEDGGWPWSEPVPGSGWCTAPAVLALAEDDASGTAVVRGGEWLIRERGRRSSTAARLLARLLRFPRLVELDPSLRGWPWVPGTSGWVEPTAWGILALRSVAGSLSSDIVVDCLADGEALLLDRACVGGGWNYGNRTVLGEDLWPYPDTTAIALLALSRRTEAPAVSMGLEALVAMLNGPASRLSLALGALALQSHGRDPSALLERLRTRWRTQASEAVATRALSLSLLSLRRALPPGTAASATEGGDVG